MFQFLHIELIAEEVSAKSISRQNTKNSTGKNNTSTKSKLNVRQIIGEAKREEGHCPHVEQPQIPITTFGVSLDLVEQMAINSKIGIYDSIGRELRVDTPILLAGVASYPRELYEKNPERLQEWVNDNLVWLQSEFGSNLKNVTLHMDETHPHIHFFCTSPSGNVKDIHPGYSAERVAIFNKEISKDDNNKKKILHTNALREFQDRYYQQIGIFHELQRVGPGRKRLTRAEKKSRDHEAKLTADLNREIREADQIVADEMQSFYQDQMDQIAVEKQKIIFEAKEAAEVIYQSKIQEAESHAQSIIQKARQEVKTIMSAISDWAKDHLKNMQRLFKAKEEIKVLKAQLQDTDKLIEQITLLENENRGLKRKVNPLK